MSDGLFVALITVVGTIVGAIIGGIIQRGVTPLGSNHPWILFLCAAVGLMTGLLIGRLASSGTPSSIISSAPTSTSAPLAATGPTETLAAAMISLPSITSTSTTLPVITLTPTNPPTPPTPTQVPTATPKPGDILYEAAWPKGGNDWAGTADWNYLRGEKVFVSDGTIEESTRERYFTWLPAPYETDNIADYAVEAEIQAGNIGDTGNLPCGNPGFGIVVRGQKDEGYRVGAFMPLEEHCITPRGFAQMAAFGKDGVQELDRVPFNTDTKWHKYRVEVKGREMKFFIDDQPAPALSEKDTRYPLSGQVGLWFDAVQISVRSFRVIKL